jgi:cation-transporting ATPase E
MAGTVTATAVMATYASARQEGVDGGAARTAAILATIIITLWVLVIVSRPLTPLRVLLVAAMAGIFAAVYFTPGINTFFSLQHRPGIDVALQSLAFGGLAGLLIDALHRSRPLSRLIGRLAPARIPEPRQHQQVPRHRDP